MPAPQLTLAVALARVQRGEFVPSGKYAALCRRNLIKVQGHGRKARPVLTEAGHQALAGGNEACG